MKRKIISCGVYLIPLFQKFSLSFCNFEIVITFLQFSKMMISQMCHTTWCVWIKKIFRCKPGVIVYNFWLHFAFLVWLSIVILHLYFIYHFDKLIKMLFVLLHSCLPPIHLLLTSFNKIFLQKTWFLRLL